MEYLVKWFDRATDLGYTSEIRILGITEINLVNV